MNGKPRSFDEFFLQATGYPPLPYQRRLATELWPARVEIPTGLGKTLAVVVGWLWRRQESHPDHGGTPRRLVYCLPMRVLVEQIRDVVASVLGRLHATDRVRLVVLMGGIASGDEWDQHPESESIIVGTQDMLLSRALNRGYGMSRYRWPLQFGLLNNDCQWLVDEVQLAGAGVATTAQLAALRRKLGTFLPSRTTWLSATLQESWLRTVDVEDVDLAGVVRLDSEDRRAQVVTERVGARKTCRMARSELSDSRGLASEILSAHRPGTRTLVIVNTVDRATALYDALVRGRPEPRIVLIHSRFRPPDRQAHLAELLATPEGAGLVAISTQVLEAGVDVSSAVLFTEVAPWASMIQRFGRCNRRGEYEEAKVFVVALPRDEKDRERAALPYRAEDLAAVEQRIGDLSDVGPASLPEVDLPLEEHLVLRRRDLVELFDTTTDVMGNDVDVSRFIRDALDLDVQVYWRKVEGMPGEEHADPLRDELASVPVGIAREWAKAGPVWRWNPLARQHVRVPEREIVPGMTLLRPCDAGGYDAIRGVDRKGRALVDPVEPAGGTTSVDSDHDAEPLVTGGRWQTLADHTSDVVAIVRQITGELGVPAECEAALLSAARWHDAGKAHPVWQAAIRKLGEGAPQALLAKSPDTTRRMASERPGFRHELASALAALAHGRSDLESFLVAAHHGKVRLLLRAVPTELVPQDAHHFARGIWHGDVLPEVDLGGGTVVPETQLSLAYMSLGDDPDTGPSWLSRVLALRDDPAMGPFRLAFLEGLLKCADERASARSKG